MSLLISLHNAHLVHGGNLILSSADWQIHRGERFALIGRNGAGKSTLLQVLNQNIVLDSGKISFQKGLSIASLPQDLSKSYGHTVVEDILNRVMQQGGLGSASITDFSVVQNKIILNARLHDDIHLIHFVKTFNELLDVMQLNLNSIWLELSGGMKRRCALMAALLIESDVLLLDEPTNHLDINAILYLEKYLKNYKGAVVLVTHDRAFLQAVATHIVGLESKKLIQYDDGYDAYLNQRAAWLAGEENETNRMQQKLIQEEHWLQRGVTARRTRNQGRLRALMELRQSMIERQKTMGAPGHWNPQLIRSGKVLVTAENITFQYGETILLKDFSFLLMKGDKLGIVGPNGCGKTTLAKILLGKIKPTSGNLKVSPNMEPIYFDQMQQKLNLQQTVMHNLVEGAEYVNVGDNKVHVAGYLKDFLFDSSQFQRPVHTLSGGEKQRLMLAKCLTEKGNLMVFDEPSNDLDLETIEHLSNMLVSYSGTVVLISHDRALIQDVVTRLLVWESPGVFREFLVSEWQPQYQVANIEKKVEPKIEVKKISLSYQEQKELLKCPDEIAKLENKIAEIHNVMGEADFYQKSASEIEKWQDLLEQSEQALETLFLRWDELEQKNKSS